MKTKTVVLLGVVALGLGSFAALAENPSRPNGGRPPGGGEGGPGHRPPPPVIAALDVNHDGTLDADEIANASKALLTLDANNDGQLTQEELRPPRRDGEGGPEGLRPPHDAPAGN